MRPWMFFWYAFVAASSLLDNLAGVPFTRQYTIRVCRAPKVRISDDAPWVIPEHELQPPPRSPDRKTPDVQALGNKARSSLSTQDDLTFVTTQLASDDASTDNLTPPLTGVHTETSRYKPIPQGLHKGEILLGFEKGYNTRGRVVMDPDEAWSAQSNPFCVIISIRGITNTHAALRVFSKLLSIAVFTVGTGMFASTTLVTIMIAVIVSSLILVAGVFGRVTAMWMASEIMQTKPVIHRVVKDSFEAEQYMDSMLRLPDCMFEILGHLVVNGRCVKRFSWHLRWSKILGVMARSYDLTKLAMHSGRPHRRRWF